MLAGKAESFAAGGTSSNSQKWIWKSPLLAQPHDRLYSRPHGDWSQSSTQQGKYIFSSIFFHLILNVLIISIFSQSLILSCSNDKISDRKLQKSFSYLFDIFFYAKNSIYLTWSVIASLYIKNSGNIVLRNIQSDLSSQCFTYPGV